MPRFDNIGLFWEDLPAERKRGGQRELGPVPPIPETGWTPPSELPDIRNAPVISLDVETRDPELTDHGPGWARGKGELCGISVAVPGKAWYVPFRHTIEPEMNLDPETVLNWARYILGNEKVPKVGANLTYDVGWLRQEGVHVKGQLYDVQFAEALLKEDSKVALEALGTKYCGIGKTVDLLKEWCLNYYGGGVTKWRANIYRAPVSLVGAYGEQDAALPLQILEKQWPLLEAQGLMDLFHMECDLINLLIDMRFAGVSVDIPYCEQLRDKFADKEKGLQERLDKEVGFGVNINAAESLSRAFDKLGLAYPRTKPTKNNPEGNPSFVKEFLEQHAHPLPKLVTEIRGLAKLRGTFVEGYLLGAHVDGKVYGSFNPLSGTDGGAKTGRFSSSAPNLQNIPSRSEEGRLIRAAFIPDEGHAEWRKYDYSQIEYRLLAHYATGEGSDNIRQLYSDDPRTDYHATTAKLIEQVTGIKLERSPVKTINFGLAYGMGIKELSRRLGLSGKQAKELFAAYHTGVPFVQSTIDALSALANERGYNTTILGRRTRFELWEPGGWGAEGKPRPYEEAIKHYGYNIERAYLYRTLNYTLQGSNADVIKASMVKCYKDGIFDVTGVPRLTVHDELDFSVKERTPEVLEAFDEMRHTMQNVIKLRVPIICDLEIGPNWGHVKEAA